MATRKKSADGRRAPRHDVSARADELLLALTEAQKEVHRLRSLIVEMALRLVREGR
jgi:hypothetical protein